MDTKRKQLEDKVERLRREMEFWKGKFYVIKHENNQLRKKIKE